MIAILADDLTSALDGAAPFAACGRSARVLLHPNALAGTHSSDVLAIDLDPQASLSALLRLLQSRPAKGVCKADAG